MYMYLHMCAILTILISFLIAIQEPEEIKLGDGYDTYQFTGIKRRCVRRYDTYHYVPFLKTLEALLTDSSVIEEIEHCQSRVRTDDKLEDFCDGRVFQEDSLFSRDPKALQIVAYYDDLEIANPLGAYVKKHKVGVVLFFLGNVQPKLRSKLRAINLVLVCKVSHIEKYGINLILQPFIRDLNKLQTHGVSVSKRGFDCTYKGSLLAFLADTAASQVLGGFKKSISSFRMCRTCMASRDTFRSKFNSNQFQLRTPDAHKSQCDRLGGVDHDHYSKVYGINERSSLLDIVGYSMLDWGLPHDCMHDLFEGVVDYEIKLVLLHCCQQGYFTLQQFNQWLIQFDYGHSETADKPTPITTLHLHSQSKHLRQGSAQSWLLLRILPFLVASHIPEDDKPWQCFIRLRKIVDICMAPLVAMDTCAVLKVLIEEHHTMFAEIYPEWSIIPKMHYMTHYPEQILALGPLIRSWTMRHEAKLYLLKCAGKISNFKNISQSIAQRHQRLMCYELATDGLFCNTTECGPLSTSLAVALRNEAPTIRDKVLSYLPNISDEVIVNRVNWTKVNSITYTTSGSYVLWKRTNAHLAEPTLYFSCIKEILIIGSNLPLFLVSLCPTEYYDEH